MTAARRLPPFSVSSRSTPPTASSRHPTGLCPVNVRSLVITHARRAKWLAGLLATVVTSAVSAATAPPAAWKTPPGWTETRGGDEGKTIRVTTLAAAGPGSLTAALAATGPRAIAFSVAGVIDLGGRSLKVTEPHVTVAGETAPNPGITLTNGDLSIVTHDVIVRHLRIRAGAGTRARGSGWEIDGLTTGGGAHDVIVDHCSFSWATDENLTASGPPFSGATPDEWRRNTSHRITFSHCIAAEGLNDSTHSKGPHSKGSLFHDNTSDIAIIGNLYVSNADRNPLFKGGVRAALVNNVVYNPGERVVQFGYVPSQWKGREPQRALLTLTGNVVRQGPSSVAEMVFFEVWPAYGPCDFQLADNLFFDRAGRALPVTAGFRDRTRFRPGFSAALAAALAGPARERDVGLGARPRRRAAVGPRRHRSPAHRGGAHR